MKLALLVLLAAVAPSAAASPPPQDAEAEAALTPEEFSAGLRKRFESHKHLSKVLFVEDATYDPVRLYLQKPQVEKPGWQAKIASAHGPFLAKLWESFRKRYVEPLKLERRPEVPLLAMCVLQTAGDYSNYCDAIPPDSVFGSSAQFERRSRFTISFHEGGSVPLPVRRSDELAEFVRAMLQAHYSGSGGEPSQVWIARGLGWYLTSGLGSDPSTLDAPKVPTGAVQALVDITKDPKARWIYLFHCADIVDAADNDALWMRMEARATKVKAAPDRRRFWLALNVQCSLWMHFLHDDPERRQRFLAYLAFALQGRGSSEGFRKAFEGTDLAALEREFFLWAFRKQLEAKPKEALDLALIDHVFEQPPAAPQPAAGAAPQPAAPAQPPPFDPRSLAPPADDLLAQHGLVLQRIRRGDLDGALNQLQAIAERARGSDIERRLARELDRLKRLIAIRGAWLERLIAGGAKHSVEVGDRKVVARFLRVEGGRLWLDENRQGVESIGLEEFSAAEIARELPKELVDSPDGWIRNYIWVLEGDERSKRGLAGTEPHLLDLRVDAEEWYPGVLQLGLAAHELALLAEAGVPTDPGTAAICLERIDGLRAKCGSFEVVRGRSDGLKELARRSLERTFYPGVLGTALPGKYEDLGGGRLRLTLDFSDPAHLGALEQDPKFFANWRSLMEIKRSTPEVSVVDGALSMVGPAACKLRQRFRGPLAVEIAALQRDTDGYSLLEVFACFRNRSNFVASAPSRILVRDERFEEECVQGEYDVLLERRYVLRITVDDEKAAAFLDGAPAGECSTHGRTDGDLVLFAHSDTPILVQHMVVEGQLDLDAARAAWVETELASRGF